MAMEEAAENVDEATPPTSTSGAVDGGEDDRISDLCDDLLVRILGQLGGDARELVRTGVLSRRWRGLWARVPDLHFSSERPELESAGDVGLYVAFVNNVLAQSDASIGFLIIALFMDRLTGGQEQQLVPSSIMEAAESWIRYAVRRQAKGFFLDLRLPRPRPPTLLEAAQEHNGETDENDDDEEKPVIDLGDLPSSAKLETMVLWLWRARVRLPSAAVFMSLERLSLCSVQLAPGSGHLLARILSSACCPRLHKVRMVCVDFQRAGTDELVVEAGELQELSLCSMRWMKSLQLRTPNLRDLEIMQCDELEAFTAVSVPALEKLTFYYNRPLVAVHADGLQLQRVWCVRTNLTTHVHDDDDDDVDINDTEIGLLRRCSSSSAISLAVHLHVPWESERRVDLIRDRMPLLPNVACLAVHLHPITERHSFGDGVAGLLTRFNNLQYLRLQLDEVEGCVKKDEYYSGDADVDSAFICKHADNWASNNGISLARLRVAGFGGLTGAGCECRFLRFLLASATGLERVAVSFSANEDYHLEGRKDDFLNRLIEDGTWTANENDYRQWYEWKPSRKVET